MRKKDNSKRPTAIPQNAQLAGLTVSRSGGMVHGEDFFFCAVPGNIAAMSCFDDEYNETELQDIPLSESEWVEIEAVVRSLTLTEDIPKKPSLSERIFSMFRRKLVVLDGMSVITFSLVWRWEDDTREVRYVWKKDEGHALLWELVFRLAQEKARTR